MSDRQPFDQGHGNFWRLLFLTLGVALGAVETAVGGWGVALGSFLLYGFLWLMWLAFLLGRRATKREDAQATKGAGS